MVIVVFFWLHTSNAETIISVSNPNFWAKGVFAKNNNADLVFSAGHEYKCPNGYVLIGLGRSNSHYFDDCVNAFGNSWKSAQPQGYTIKNSSVNANSLKCPSTSNTPIVPYVFCAKSCENSIVTHDNYNFYSNDINVINISGNGYVKCPTNYLLKSFNSNCQNSFISGKTRVYEYLISTIDSLTNPTSVSCNGNYTNTISIECVKLN